MQGEEGTIMEKKKETYKENANRRKASVHEAVSHHYGLGPNRDAHANERNRLQHFRAVLFAFS